MLRKKEISAVELTQYYLKRIKEKQSLLKSFITISGQTALKMAKRADDKLQKEIRKNHGINGSNGNRANHKNLLMGIPIAIKDNILVQGIRNTCASRILNNFIAPYNATVVQKLIDQGCVIVGKTNMDEFAMGSSNENSAYGPVLNPWDDSRSPGGSSGGSASAVAARLVPLALGSDTGGSVRQPASFCGVMGLKPTYGRVSRFGLTAFSSSLEQIGPIACQSEGIALLLQTIAGGDQNDSTSLFKNTPDYLSEMKKTISGMTIGYLEEFYSKDNDPEVSDTIEDAVKTFIKLGCKVKKVSLPNIKYAIPVYYMIASAEASSNLARFDGVNYGVRSSSFANGNINMSNDKNMSNNERGRQSLDELYEYTRQENMGKEVKRRILLGTFGLRAGYYKSYYGKADNIRTRLCEDYKKILKEVDLIVGPTAPTTAFSLGEKVNDPLKMYLSDIYTTLANLVGAPAISLPCGFDSKGLPIGMQLMSGHFKETQLLRGAFHYERATEWINRYPSI